MEPLPIDPLIPAVLAALREHGAAVLTAPPGSGKSTRVPPALLDLVPAGRQVVLLQPRRVAATGLARRIAAERGWDCGGQIGYRIRFDACGGPTTRLWVETEGTLTRQLQRDPYLESVGAVVLDEFHERSNHCDLALAWLAELRRRVRPELKLLVMSATLDATPVAAFLDNAPILSGGTAPHPVTRQLRPAHNRERLPEHVVRVLDEALAADDAGDVLVFLPGVGEIERCRTLLAGRGDLTVLPLHGSLPMAEQDTALQPSARRKVVLATNVAETSLTISGVRTVIDSGLARVARFDPDRGLDELRLEGISAFSVDQRRGRAGRTAPGRCFGLWSRLEDQRRPTALDPEVRRCDLAPLLVAIKRLHGGACSRFPWFEAPEAERLRQAEELLVELGFCATIDGDLTAQGSFLADLPLHPRLSRLLAESVARGCPALGCALAALAGERDLRPLRDDRPTVPGPADLLDRLDRLARARQAHFSGSLYGEGIDATAARQVDRVIDQLQRQARHCFGDAADNDANREVVTEVPRLVLVAWPDRVGTRQTGDPNRLLLAGGGAVSIPPASCCHAVRGETRPPLVVAHAVQGFGGRGTRRRLLRLGADLSEELLREVFPTAVVEETQLRYIPEHGRVEAALVRRYRDLVIAYRPGVEAAAAAVADCLAAGMTGDWSAILANHPAAEQLLHRWRWLAATTPEAGLPDFSAADQTQTLRALCNGCRNRDQVLAKDPLPALKRLLGHAPLMRLDAWAPEAIRLPRGSAKRLDYAGARPVLALRIQEAFGLVTTPRLANGRVPVLVHLLAPNGRPAQITDDLESFWATTYAQVRKDLRGRYPKHNWPEDPRTAFSP